MSDLAAFIYGLLLGFFSGSYIMFIHMKKTKEKHIYHITKEQAIDLIESDKEIKMLKKELNIK